MKRYLLLGALLALVIAGAAAGAAKTDDPPGPFLNNDPVLAQPISLSAVGEQPAGKDDPADQPVCKTDQSPSKDNCLGRGSAGTFYTSGTDYDPNRGVFFTPECAIKDAKIATYLLSGTVWAVIGSGKNQCTDVVLTLGYSGCIQGHKAAGWKNLSCYAAQRHNRQGIKAEADYACPYTTIPDNYFRYQYFVWVTYFNGATYVSPTRTSPQIDVPFCHV